MSEELSSSQTESEASEGRRPRFVYPPFATCSQSLVPASLLRLSITNPGCKQHTRGAAKQKHGQRERRTQQNSAERRPEQRKMVLATNTADISKSNCPLIVAWPLRLFASQPDNRDRLDDIASSRNGEERGHQAQPASSGPWQRRMILPIRC